MICDINDLKLINDTQGHKAGDEYIQASCRLICRTFAHCPVFRVGGDEFAVFIKGQDYSARENIIAAFRRQVEENIRLGNGPVIASGFAEYQPSNDENVEEIFKRADNRMYEDKVRLKEMKLLGEPYV